VRVLQCPVCKTAAKGVVFAVWGACPRCGAPWNGDFPLEQKENGVEHEILQAMAQIRGYVLDHYGENSRSGRIGLGTFALLAQLEGQILCEMEAEYGADPLRASKSL